MIKNLLGIKNKRRPVPRPTKERTAKSVPTRRFNDMIEYYTKELKSRIDEINKLKEENQMLIKTSLKSAARSDELRLHNQKLAEDNRKLQER